MPASMPIRQGGTFASRAAIRPRAGFSRKTTAPLASRANQMQCVLACIDADRTGQSSFRLLGHGDVLLVLLSPPAKPLGAGARPVHPILRRSDHGRACPFIGVKRSSWLRATIDAIDPSRTLASARECEFAAHSITSSAR